MPIEFTLIQVPENQVLKRKATKPVMLFGVEIVRSIGSTRTVKSRMRSPKLINFLGLNEASSDDDSATRKRRKVLNHVEPDGPWKIRKKLYSTDVGPNWGHLQLSKAEVRAHILPLMDEEALRQLEGAGSTRSVNVRLVDDETLTVHDNMKFTYYSTSKGYVLNGSWNKICAERELKENDVVGLYWEPSDKLFRFSVRERAR